MLNDKEWLIFLIILNGILIGTGWFFLFGARSSHTGIEMFNVPDDYTIIIGVFFMLFIAFGIFLCVRLEKVLKNE
jgi:hypothetical protein